MLNKELLPYLNSKRELEYTNIIMPETVPVDFVGYEIYNYGELLPDTFNAGDNEPLRINVLFNSALNTFMEVEGGLFVSYLYIGRTDTREIISASGSDIDESTGTADFVGALFREEDIGKRIKLWIGTTPPPLGLEDALEGVAYVKQRATPDREYNGNRVGRNTVPYRNKQPTNNIGIISYRRGARGYSPRRIWKNNRITTTYHIIFPSSISRRDYIHRSFEWCRNKRTYTELATKQSEIFNHENNCISRSSSRLRGLLVSQEAPHA